MSEFLHVLDLQRAVTKHCTCGGRGPQDPLCCPACHEGQLRPVSRPAPTVCTDGAIALIEPFIVEYYGTGGAESVDQPLNTVTSKHRHGLVQPHFEQNGICYRLDILFRMFEPHELAGAQGFRRGYQFTGTKTEQVCQIGNAVPRNLARALVLAALSQQSDIRPFLA